MYDALAVALRKESVDRNMVSMMARPQSIVALRKESVDRNMSPPASRYCFRVALRKESVDRNTVVTSSPTEAISRSPQGERG